ncbi:hypothetical protein MPNTM1_00393 [Mycolicibacterium parafortuitum]|uniref:hypothetical protein n=1 Tax=Mycolicibacterium parafortuitum TaxID=39692 RepID=UPI0032C4940F
MSPDLPLERLLDLLPHNRTLCRGILGTRVATQGSGPCEEPAFDDFLAACGIDVHLVLADDPEPDVVIFGREDWLEGDVDALWERTEGKGVRVYSQEMVFASLMIGHDLYETVDGEINDLLDSFITGHPALERFFYTEPEQDVEVVHYPQTANVAPTVGRKIVVNLDTGEWPTTGVLGFLGYRVGRTGLGETARRGILAEALSVELVAGSPAATAYIAEWGPPNSNRRLQKMVNSLSAFARSARRRSADFSQAIADWESDLNWLRATYGASLRR